MFDQPVKDFKGLGLFRIRQDTALVAIAMFEIFD